MAVRKEVDYGYEEEDLDEETPQLSRFAGVSIRAHPSNPSIATVSLTQKNAWNRADLSLIRDVFAKVFREQGFTAVQLDMLDIQHLESGTFGMLIDWVENGNIRIFLEDTHDRIRQMLWFGRFTRPTAYGDEVYGSDDVPTAPDIADARPLDEEEEDESEEKELPAVAEPSEVTANEATESTPPNIADSVEANPVLPNADPSAIIPAAESPDSAPDTPPPTQKDDRSDFA